MSLFGSVLVFGTGGGRTSINKTNDLILNLTPENVT